MVVSFSGMVIELKFEHSSNACGPKLVTVSVIVTDTKFLQDLNAPSPMLVTPAGMLTSVASGQSLHRMQSVGGRVRVLGGGGGESLGKLLTSAPSSERAASTTGRRWAGLLKASTQIVARSIFSFSNRSFEVPRNKT